MVSHREAPFCVIPTAYRNLVTLYDSAKLMFYNGAMQMMTTRTEGVQDRQRIAAKKDLLKGAATEIVGLALKGTPVAEPWCPYIHEGGGR
jgi:hypothetical protein